MITNGVYYPPTMENQMEKKIENEMETGGIQGLKEIKIMGYLRFPSMSLDMTHVASHR